MEVIYLKKGQRRPRGIKTLLIDCKPHRMGETVEQSPIGSTWFIRTDELENALATLSKQGASRVYVRGVPNA